MKDRFKEFGIAFKNEAFVEEELDGEFPGLTLEDVERSYYNDSYEDEF